jgi:hypothetical protein
MMKNGEQDFQGEDGREAEVKHKRRTRKKV